MNTQPVAMTREAHKALDQYLSQVREAMQRGGPPEALETSEVRSVLADLEAQILDMLAARGATAQEADVRSVLAQMDAPEDYAQGSPERTRGESPTRAPSQAAQPPVARLSGMAVVSATLTGLCLFLCVPFLLIAFTLPALGRARYVAFQEQARHGYMAPDTQRAIGPTAVQLATIRAGRTDGMLVLLPTCSLVPLGLPGILLGLAAISSIRHSRGRLYGLGWAYFGTWALPMVWLTVLVSMLPAGIAAGITCTRLAASPAVMVWTGVVLALALDVVLIRKLCRSAERYERAGG